MGILPECYQSPVDIKLHPQLNVHATTFVPQSSSINAQTLITQFPSVFDNQIRSMDGEQFHISLTRDENPFCIKALRSILFAYRDKLKDELNLLLSQNIIAPVTTVTEWCAPIFITPKKNSNRISMCVDLAHLNKHVLRERFQPSTPAQAVADIAATDAKIFTVLDALKGYHQCPLDESSQLSTKFIKSFGRYKYLQAPYGISSISEHYNCSMAEAFAGLQGFHCIVDDIVIYDSTVSDHAAHVRQFLQRCVERKIALNLDKCQFFHSTVTFAGFKLSSDGY